jgi:hypothetical protein
MRPAHASLAAALIGVVVSLGYAQTPTPSEDADTPVFRSQAWGYMVVDFTTRLASYDDLRSRLEKGLPPLKVTDYPAEIARTQRALARRIRVARRGARQGEIFTPAISAEFKKALTQVVDANTRETIMDDNPGSLPRRINRTYPNGEPFSTVPANVLVALPRLPDDIQYRFLGADLVLLDTRSNVILDRLPCAIQCTS